MEASAEVKTAVHTYKGQPYVQINGGDAAVTEKVNQILKDHAISVAKANKAWKNYDAEYYTSSVKTLYNNNKVVSVGYVDGLKYNYENKGTYFSVIYNFDLTTGQRIMIRDIVDSKDKEMNLEYAISRNLQLKYSKGIKIYEKSVYDIRLTDSTPFYFYEKGIVIRFYPSEVAEYSVGFIDIKIPYSDLNEKGTHKLISYLDYLRNHVTDYIDSEIDYFEGYRISSMYSLANGEVWEQVEPRFIMLPSYSLSSNVRIYKDGARYYLWVEDMEDVVEVIRVHPE